MKAIKGTDVTSLARKEEEAEVVGKGWRGNGKWKTTGKEAK